MCLYSSLVVRCGAIERLRPFAPEASLPNGTLRYLICIWDDTQEWGVSHLLHAFVFANFFPCQGRGTLASGTTPWGHMVGCYFMHQPVRIAVIVLTDIGVPSNR